MRITDKFATPRARTQEKQALKESKLVTSAEVKDTQTETMELLSSIEKHDGQFVRDLGWLHSPLKNREHGVTAKEVQEYIAQSGAAYDGSLYVVHTTGTARIGELQDIRSASTYLKANAEETEPNVMHRVLNELDSRGWSFRELDKNVEELSVRGPFGAFVEVPGPGSGQMDAVSPGSTHLYDLTYDNLLGLDFVHGRKNAEVLTNPDQAPLLQDIMKKGFNIGSTTDWQGVETLNRTGKASITHQGHRVGEISDQTDPDALKDTLGWALEKASLLCDGQKNGSLSKEGANFARYAFDQDLPEGTNRRASMELGLALLEAGKPEQLSHSKRWGYESAHQFILKQVAPSELSQAAETQSALIKMGGLDFLNSLHGTYSQQAEHAKEPVGFQEFFQNSLNGLSQPQDSSSFARTAKNLFTHAPDGKVEDVSRVLAGLMSKDDELGKFAELTEVTAGLQKRTLSGYPEAPGSKNYDRATKTKRALLIKTAEGIEESTSYGQLAEVVSTLLNEVGDSKLYSNEKCVWSRGMVLAAGESMAEHFSSHPRSEELTHFRERNGESYSAHKELSFLRSVGVKTLRDAAAQADKVGPFSITSQSGSPESGLMDATRGSKPSVDTVPIHKKPTHYSSAPKFRKKQYNIARGKRDKAINALKKEKKERLMRNGVPALAMTMALGGAGLLGLGVTGVLAALSKVGLATGGMGLFCSVAAIDEGHDVRRAERELDKQEQALNVATYALDRTSD